MTYPDSKLQAAGRTSRPNATRSGGLTAIRRAHMLLFGLSIAAPILLLPGQLQSPRLTDFALLVTAIFTLPTTRPARRVAFAGGGIVLCSWLIQTLVTQSWPDLAEIVFYLRWVGAVVAAPGLVELFQRQPGTLRVFLFGIVIGATLHVVTFFLAAAGLRDALTAVGLASPRAVTSWVAAQVRFTTMVEHPNAAMALVALSVPAALTMSLVGRRVASRWSGGVVAFSLLLLVVGFYYTLSRAALIASAVAVLFYLAARRDRFAVATPMVLIFLLSAVLIVLQAFALEFDGTRYAARVDVNRLEQNLTERALTWGQAISSALSRPFGLGWSGYLESSPFVGAIRASHNGYIFTARTVGIPLLLFVFIGHFRAFFSRVSALISPLLAYVVVAMFAEDLTQGASFTFLVALLAVFGWLGVVKGRGDEVIGGGRS